MKLTRDLLNSVYNKTRGRCWYCGSSLPPFSDWQVDHQLPRSRNGEDELFNLVPSCRGCNIRKSNKTVEEYRQSLLLKIARAIGGAVDVAETVEGLVDWPDGEPPEWTTSIICSLSNLADDALKLKPRFYGERLRNEVFQEVIHAEMEA